MPTEADLWECRKLVAKVRVESAGLATLPRRLVEALCRLASMEVTLGHHDEALVAISEACEATQAIGDDALVAHCHQERGELLRLLLRHEEAHTAFTTAVARLRPHLEDQSKVANALVRSLQELAKVLEALGRRDEAAVVLAEAVERGSLAPRTDTLIIAEVPLAGRRRFDRAVFRRGLDCKKPYFGKKLGKHVGKRVAEPTVTPLAVNVAQLVLEALEDPKIVARDPFTTNDRILIAGVSNPSPPFYEPEHDFTPSWSNDDAARTGWVLGVCTNAEAVHAKLMVDLEALIELAEEGKLPLFPPRGSKRQVRRPPGDLIGPEARKLAPGAAWLAMAGTTEPVREGTRVASVAARRLNDLLYNFERKIQRNNKGGHGPSEPLCTCGIETEELPIDEHRRRIDALLRRFASETWAQDGKALVARCSAHREPDDDDLIELGADMRAYGRKHAKEPRAAQVFDFVTAWILHMVDRRT